MTANVYHHASNQIAAEGSPYGFDLYFCCSSNVHQGWPKFLMGAVHEEDSSGVLVVSSLVPSVSQLVSDATADSRRSQRQHIV